MSDHAIPLGLSFDDVLLVPSRSDILPGEADIRSTLTGRIGLNIPIVSAAMDTVTEAGLAIALAREGGLGVVHRNMPIEDQAAQIARVKRSENTVIPNPFTVPKTMTLVAMQEVMAEKGVSGFPVVGIDGLLEGMVTNRDIWFIENPQQRVEDVMTPRNRLITAPEGTGLEEAKKILYKNRIEKLPLVDSAGVLVGLITSQDIEKRQRFTNSCMDGNGQLRVGGAVGVDGDSLERARELIAAGADALFIDAATGHTSRVMHMVERLVSDLGCDVVAGNVVTPEGARDLHAAGASAVKVGVGPGSICTTRVIAGVGVPQFSAIQAVAVWARQNGVRVIADGGIRYSGDIVKAIAAGADVVMLGSLLAGTAESPGNLIQHQGRTFKEYRGMGSLKAMRKGSGDRYGQNSSGKLVPEGVEGRVPYRGPLRETIFQLLGGLRSGMGYVGASSLDALRTKARFMQITAGGLKESHAHDVVVTEEPVNYQMQ
jgi:IMP dehydrogenase